MLVEAIRTLFHNNWRFNFELGIRDYQRACQVARARWPAQIAPYPRVSRSGHHDSDETNLNTYSEPRSPESGPSRTYDKQLLVSCPQPTIFAGNPRSPGEQDRNAFA